MVSRQSYNVSKVVKISASSMFELSKSHFKVIIIDMQVWLYLHTNHFQPIKFYNIHCRWKSPGWLSRCRLETPQSTWSLSGRWRPEGRVSPGIKNKVHGLKKGKNQVPGSKIKDQNPNERLGATLISRSSGKLTPKLSASVNISSPRPVHFFEISPIWECENFRVRMWKAILWL